MDMKISDLPLAEKLENEDLIPIVQDGENKTIFGNLINRREMLWQKPGAIGWSSGNITLNDSVLNYNYLIIIFETTAGADIGTYAMIPVLQQDELLSTTTTGYLRGAGITTTTTQTTYFFMATYQYATPNILTYIGIGSLAHTPSSNHSALTSNPVRAIIGVK